MTIIHGDCLDAMRGMDAASVDLVFCSPPYEAARTYGIAFKLKDQDWVDWAVERFVECCRVSRGLVAWVVEGQTRQFRWSATPALLMADLHRRGVKLRKPPAFCRAGIPGSGGPDWLRNDYEFIVCAAPGKLPWSDNTAMGHPPKWGPGGEMSNRLSSGARVNQRGGSPHGMGNKKSDETLDAKVRPSHVFGNTPSEACGREGYKRTYFNGKGHPGAWLGRGNPKGSIAAPAWTRPHTKTMADGSMREQLYTPPVLANPGNLIRCHVGGNLMGSKLAHENEAPFPERLAEFFVRSFCPPGGTVLDPFAGSGTTLTVAKRLGRNSIGIDLRESQVDLATRRVGEVAT